MTSKKSVVGRMPEVSMPLTGTEISLGGGFDARSFRAREVGASMDPLVMVDHYVMTTPTFGVHPHAGMSAVSLLFEDSEGLFWNRDSLGNDFDLEPGDLYWLKAGSGAVHDEAPRANSRIHGLQVFVNVPQSDRFEAPESLLVRAGDMPVIESRDYRVRVALGESHGVRGVNSPSVPMTILDGSIAPGGDFVYEANANRGLWIHTIEEDLTIAACGQVRLLAAGQAIAISAAESTEIRLSNPAGRRAQFALFDGAKINETYVQDGPFVMGTAQEIVAVREAYSAGRLGGIGEG